VLCPVDLPTLTPPPLSQWPARPVEAPPVSLQRDRILVVGADAQMRRRLARLISHLGDLIEGGADDAEAVVRTAPTSSWLSST